MDGTAAIGTSLAFARQDHIHPFDTATVRNNAAQSLTAAQQQQARQNIFAAPFDAMAYNGLQINGDMVVAQELGTGGRSTPGYVVDGWTASWQGTMAILTAQYTAAFFPGFAGMVYLNVNTAQTTLSGTDLAYLFQPIEGYRIARLAWGTANAQPITIGFWSSHHRPGLYSVAVRNTGGVRSYVASYTHNAADTSQYNVVTIPGDTGGTWASDNSFSFSVAFTMASGSTYIAPAVNTWYSAN
jgi:hypothetical protein